MFYLTKIKLDMFVLIENIQLFNQNEHDLEHMTYVIKINNLNTNNYDFNVTFDDMAILK